MRSAMPILIIQGYCTSLRVSANQFKKVYCYRNQAATSFKRSSEQFSRSCCLHRCSMNWPRVVVKAPLLHFPSGHSCTLFQPTQTRVMLRMNFTFFGTLYAGFLYHPYPGHVNIYPNIKPTLYQTNQGTEF